MKISAKSLQSLLRGMMRNKLNFTLWCLVVFVLAACTSSQVATDTPAAIVTSAATDTPAAVATSAATVTPVIAECAQVTEIPQAECAALVALYKSANGPNWTDNTDWLKTATPCDWVGVECSDGHVTKLALTKNLLAGVIPPETGNLANLTSLDLSNNQLTVLPPEIGNLSNLTELSIWGNQLTGLPPEIENLSSLARLTFSDNQLTVLPPEIGNLSNLTELHLEFNQLTSLPPELGNLSNLTILLLQANRLTGLPPEIGNLANLQELYLNGNSFTSRVPPSIMNLGKLTHVALSPCSGLTSSDLQVIAFLDARAPGWNQCP